MEKGNSLLETKKKNRIMIRNEIFRREYVTRSEIAEILGLTLPTVTTSVNQMMKEGLVEELPMPETLLKSGKGRPPLAIAFRKDAATFLGVDCARHETRLVLMDLGRNVLVEEVKPVIECPYEEALDIIEEYVTTFIKEHHCTNIKGVGLGLTGIVDAEKGIFCHAPYGIEDWSGKPICRNLEERLHMPICADNNGHMRAIRYEMENGLLEDQPFAYFFAANGLICPMAIQYSEMDGFLYTEGEIGQMIMDTNGRIPKRLNNYARYFIVNEGWRLIDEGLLEKDESRDLDNPIQMYYWLLEKQKEGNTTLDQLFHQVLDNWAVGVINLLAIHYPRTVVTESRVLDNEKNLEYFIQKIRELESTDLYNDNVNIIHRPYDKYGSAKGSALCVIKRKFISD